MKIWKYLFIVFVLMTSGVTYTYANVARLALIDYSDFREVYENVYFSDELPVDAEQKVTALLADARRRIATHYGESYADPVIVVLGNEEERKNYGLNDLPGTLLSAPWSSYLLLNYQTVDINVTAHELVHAEVVHRVGYLKRQLDIPTWFDEGVAMQVDYREQYDSQVAIEQAEFLRLVSLDKPAKFWGHDKNQNMKNYRVAKSVVSEILKQSDKGLYDILSSIQSGEEAVITSLVRETNIYMTSRVKGNN